MATAPADTSRQSEMAVNRALSEQYMTIDEDEIEMSMNTLFAFLFIALITMTAQAEKSSESSAAAPVTPHQTQAVEGTESGIETTEESKASQDEATQAVPSSPHQEQALEEPAMQFRRLDQDQNGRISKGEVKGDQDLAENWDRLDDNGDGNLSPEEFEKFSRQISSP
ncbi:MAG: hypothetical protein ACRED0_07400 [Gammaproteobacteria bacterium]